MKKKFNKDYRRYNKQTEYGIKLNENNIQYLENHRLDDVPYPINFTEFTEEENNIIKMVVNSRSNICSVDKTHSKHSKNFTKNRNKDRNFKLNEVL